MKPYLVKQIINILNIIYSDYESDNCANHRNIQKQKFMQFDQDLTRSLFDIKISKVKLFDHLKFSLSENEQKCS